MSVSARVRQSERGSKKQLQQLAQQQQEVGMGEQQARQPWRGHNRDSEAGCTDLLNRLGQEHQEVGVGEW